MAEFALSITSYTHFRLRFGASSHTFWRIIMSTFGAGGLMFCFVAGIAIMAPTIGFFQAGFAMVMLTLGYVWFLGAINDTFYPNGDLRPRKTRRRRRR
jgi:hypothetical protein